MYCSISCSRAEVTVLVVAAEQDLVVDPRHEAVLPVQSTWSARPGAAVALLDLVGVADGVEDAL